MDDEKKQYSKISKEIRQEIIDKIYLKKQSLLEVAQEYELLPSTCKSIVNTYLKEGRVGKKESRIRKLNKVVTTYNVILNPVQPFLSTLQVSKSVENCVELSEKSKQETEVHLGDPQQKIPNLDNCLQQWAQQVLNQFHSMNRTTQDQLANIRQN